MSVPLNSVVQRRKVHGNSTFDHDEFRFGPSVDLGDGKEELPFAAVGEILLKVGFSSDFTSHFY